MEKSFARWVKKLAREDLLALRVKAWVEQETPVKQDPAQFFGRPVQPDQVLKLIP